MSFITNNAGTVQPYQAKVEYREPLPTENAPMAAFDRQVVRDQKDQRFERQEQDAAINRETEAWQQMMKNPQRAPDIAAQYGVEYTPEMGEILKDEKLSQRTLEAATMAQKMGINHPETLRVWMREYVKPGGNVLSAQTATQGMKSKYERPRSGSNIPKTTGLPKGYMWGADGTATPIPGVDPRQYNTDPLKNPNLPLPLRMEGEALMNSDIPQQRKINEWFERAKPYLEPQGGAMTPDQLGGMINPQPELNVGDTISVPSLEQMNSNKVTVSNGKEVFRIAPEDVEDAMKDGFEVIQ